MISHKLLRWAVPWFLLLAALSNIAIIGDHWLYNTTALAQLLLYGMALSGWRSTQLRQHVAIRIVFFFIQVNLAIAEATVKFIAGTRMTVWAPSAR